MSENSENLRNYGDYFQQKSKYIRNNLSEQRLNWLKKPEIYKSYENPIAKIELPKPEFNENKSFWKALLNRESTRNFSNKPLSLMELSLLLFGMSGITRIYPQFQFRTVPSAGGLYPIEIYPIINNIEGLERGIYHYNILQHELECLKKGDFRTEITKGCLDQKMVFKSAVNFVWTAIIKRSKWKYLQRCFRYIYLDAGHIGQNFYLIAEALDLGACTIGAFYDEELNELLDINGINETTVYVGIVGKKFKRN
jgi:SagB-type dehydrogenase family enzyme